MGSARPSRGVSIKEFIEGHVITEILIFLEARVKSIYLANSFTVLEEDFRQAIGEFHCDLVDGEKYSRPRGALDFEIVAVIVVELLQRLDDEEVHRKPDGTTPV